MVVNLGQPCQVDPFVPTADRHDGSPCEERGHLADGPFAHGQNMRGKGRLTQGRRLTEWQDRFEAREQRGVVGISLSARHGKGGKAVLQLLVAPDRQIGVPRAHTDQGDTERVAETPEESEEGTLLSTRPGEDIVHFIKNQHAETDLLEQAQGEIFDFG